MLSRVMKYIEPSLPVAIRPRNSAPASKLHIRIPALSAADAAPVLSARGTPFLTTGVDIGHGDAVHVPTSTSTPTDTIWLLTPELLAWTQVHPGSPIV